MSTAPPGADSGRNSRRTTTAALASAWIVPGLVTALTSAALVPDALGKRSLGAFIALQLLSWAVWAAATPLIVVITERFPLERGRVVRSVGVHVAAACGCALVQTVVLVYLLQPEVGRLTRAMLVSLVARNFFEFRLGIGLVSYTAIAGAALTIAERRSRREQMVRALRLESDLSHAQLQTLQMQLQPHFLFNTLHAIRILVRENPAAAEQMVTELAELLRRTLALANVPQLSLDEEIDMLRQYLSIEQSRFGDRLKVTIQVPAELLDISVPTFILQPLVENALRHGIAPRVDAGCVAIRAAVEGDTLRLDIEDDGPGFDATPRGGGAGIGLAATRARLTALYGERASLHCSDAPARGTRVSLRLPIERG